MVAVKVDPPPVAMSIVDPKTGMPTRPFIEFIHRLWQRTGGLTDDIENLDLTNSYPFFRILGQNEQEDIVNPLIFPGTHAKPQQIDEAEARLVSLLSSRAPNSDIYAELEAIRAMVITTLASFRSQIGELREEVESLQKVATYSYIQTAGRDKKAP